MENNAQLRRGTRDRLHRSFADAQDDNGESCLVKVGALGRQTSTGWHAAGAESLMFPSNELGNTAVVDGFLVVQYAQLLERMEEFVFLQKMHGVGWPISELNLVDRVSLVDEEPMRGQCLQERGKDFSIEIIEDKNEIVLLVP